MQETLATSTTDGREPGPVAPCRPPERFQILALDGGGIRGLYTAALLAALERDHNIKIVDHFDLIAGTSTGGILALGLALGLPPADLVRFYEKEGPRIFPSSWQRTRWVRHLFRAKYSARELERSLRDAFGEKKIGDCTRAIVLPTYNLDTDRPVALKTPHHPNFVRDLHIPAWQAGLATSAAPTYLPASVDIGGSRHVDGGMWANNPALIGAIEARKFLRVPLDAIRVLSIGTGRVVKARSEALGRGGRLTWREDAVDIFFRAQGEGAQNMVRMLIGDDRVHRLNPEVPETWDRLDVLRREYASRANEDAKAFGPTFAQQFQQHRGLPLAQLRAVVDGVGKDVENARN